MTIDVSQLMGKHVYLGLLSPDHREIIRPIARDERIWEFNKLLFADENYDRMFDAYFEKQRLTGRLWAGNKISLSGR